MILVNIMKITELKVIYICPDHNEKYHTRKLHMDTLLHKIGFTDIVHYKSSTEKYPACLVNATNDILTKYINEPILLLEDDVEFTGVIDFEVPDNADAIYFGLSKCGGSKTINLHDGPSIFEAYSRDTVRVLNMLGGHAILYISPQYKKAVIDIFDRYKNTSYYNDILLSRIQANYNVYALKKPVFYQANKFNQPHDLEAVTKFIIDI
jgi:hypothetical protein